VRRAQAGNAKSVAVTFEPTRRILRPDHNLKLLTRFQKTTPAGSGRRRRGSVAPVSRDLSLMTPHHFAHEILKKRLHAREVHEGYNFHFGHKAAGNIEMLRELAGKWDLRSTIIPRCACAESTFRAATSASCFRRPSQPRAPFAGTSVQHSLHRRRGRGYGSKYTVPTINLARYEELVPKDGVYITRTRIGQEHFDSVTNVGNRPTFGADSFAIETHLLNFHPIELSAETEVEIHFLDRLRDEIKFPSVEALKEQIGRDVARRRSISED